MSTTCIFQGAGLFIGLFYRIECLFLLLLVSSISCRWVVTLLLFLCLVDHLPAVIGADLYVSPGGTVTLPCGGAVEKYTSETVVVWKIHGVTNVCSFQNGTWCENPDFENRIQLASIQQKNFSLVINDVRLQDQGAYKCVINGAVMQRIRLFVRGPAGFVSVFPPQSDGLVCKPYKEVPDNPPGATSSVRLIVSLSVILGIVVIVVIVVLLVVHQKNIRT